MSGIDLVVDPGVSIRIGCWIGVGVLLGAISGSIPGLHANNVAFVLAGVAPQIPGPPLLVGVAMLAAGVVHTFVNAIPAMAIGVPDAEMALTTLPGHRLVLAGRGHEAIQLSAVGSLLAVVFAVPIAVPLTWIVVRVYPFVIDHLGLVLACVVCGLLIGERTPRRVLGGALTVALATGLGLTVLDVDPAAPLHAGGVLAPIFAGLFGAPVLIDAVDAGGVPKQDDARIRRPRWAVGSTAFAGTVAGAIVGFLPGVSAAIAAVAVLSVVPGTSGIGSTDDREYIVATSGVDTANAVFALIALVVLGQPRTGVMVAFDATGAPVVVPVVLASVLVAGTCGFAIVVLGGSYYLEFVGRANYAVLSIGVLALLVGLSWLFAGPLGVVVFCVSSVIGLVPVRLGVRRVHLMGVLLGPLILSAW
ncbi:tripartite tricarboxylate transporter permease [Halovivax cerinus]|uniref:Tripartite tricarboxylate transporter permease n=1 Tax=Halovivax cerinus TaxID=1487865 RepID=A0ABD5NSR3_9EURY|nr:tripartite tricarboxylate transporter permease [Halovivax cerinus]